jgi:hypothetical protein
MAYLLGMAAEEMRAVLRPLLLFAIFQIGGSKKARAGSTGLAVPVTLVFRPGIT